MAKEQKNKRLCTEIQLFDLCDKGLCCYKDGRYCTSDEALARFEAILDEEDHSTEQFLADELESDEGDEYLDFAEDDYYGEEDRELNEEEDF